MTEADPVGAMLNDGTLCAPVNVRPSDVAACAEIPVQTMEAASAQPAATRGMAIVRVRSSVIFCAVAVFTTAARDIETPESESHAASDVARLGGLADGRTLKT